jgi:hypothetical protein
MLGPAERVAVLHSERVWPPAVTAPIERIHENHAASHRHCASDLMLFETSALLPMAGTCYLGIGIIVSPTGALFRDVSINAIEVASRRVGTSVGMCQFANQLVFEYMTENWQSLADTPSARFSRQDPAVMI